MAAARRRRAPLQLRPAAPSEQPIVLLTIPACYLGLIEDRQRGRGRIAALRAITQDACASQRANAKRSTIIRIGWMSWLGTGVSWWADRDSTAYALRGRFVRVVGGSVVPLERGQRSGAGGGSAWFRRRPDPISGLVERRYCCSGWRFSLRWPRARSATRAWPLPTRRVASMDRRCTSSRMRTTQSSS
jgi:hypothetical protein